MLLHVKRVCDICGSTKTYVDKHNYEQWRNKAGKRYCQKCFAKYFDNPKTNLKWRPRRYCFGDKRLFDYKPVRTGQCSKCGIKIGETYRGWRNRLITVKQTQMHHEFYLVICPWFGKVEVCVACHGKIGWIERHKRQVKEKQFCSLCGTTENYKSNSWRRHPNGNLLCFKCWRKTVYNPRRELMIQGIPSHT